MPAKFPADPELIPSASVIVVRNSDPEPEFLLVQRNQKIKFHGGAWVFPGGKIDADDHERAASEDAFEIAKHAAVREASEEVGVDLDPGELIAFSHWTTPVQMPKRFSTWFFIAAVSNEAVVTIDDSEIVDHRWLPAGQALSLQAADEITLPAPTFVSLTKLMRLKRDLDLAAYVQTLGYQEFAPRIVENELGRIALYHGDAGFETVDSEASGPRHRLKMHRDGWHYERS